MLRTTAPTASNALDAAEEDDIAVAASSPMMVGTETDYHRSSAVEPGSPADAYHSPVEDLRRRVTEPRGVGNGLNDSRGNQIPRKPVPGRQ